MIHDSKELEELCGRDIVVAVAAAGGGASVAADVDSAPSAVVVGVPRQYSKYDDYEEVWYRE